MCGKRIARYMPQLSGAWLAGLYDNDKSVSRAAQDSFKLVFPTEEKYKNVWRVFQSDIVGWCKNVVENETANTLSDERTTSPDDANMKYTRTLGSVLTVVFNLIGKRWLFCPSRCVAKSYRNYAKGRPSEMRG